MTKSLAQCSDVMGGPTAMQSALSPENDSLTPNNRWLATVLVWMERSQQRQALREIALRDGHMLTDVGLSREQALREAAKPFWRR